MSLFVCANRDCLTVDNTALAPTYWRRELDDGGAKEPPLCTACSEGKWHGKFPQRRYNAERDGRMHEPSRLILQ